MPLLKRAKLIPEGTYVAKIVAVSELQEMEAQSGTCHCLTVSFKLPSGKVINKNFYIYNGEVKDSDLLGILIKAVYGENQDDVDTDDFINSKCNIKLTHMESKKGNVWENITGITPLYREDDGEYEQDEEDLDNASDSNSNPPTPKSSQVFSDTPLASKRRRPLLPNRQPNDKSV